MKVLAMVGVAFVVLVAGCLPSLHAVYTDADTYVDESLAGTWITDEGSDTWQCVVNGDGYDLEAISSDGTTAACRAHLTRINDAVILDLYPRPPECLPGAPIYLHLPVHMVFRLEGTGDTLQLTMLDPGWLERELKADPAALAHVTTTEGDLVVTAETAELRGFVGDHLDDAKAFAAVGKLYRQAGR